MAGEHESLAETSFSVKVSRLNCKPPRRAGVAFIPVFKPTLPADVPGVTTPARSSDADADAAPEQGLYCRQCGQLVTRPIDAVEINARHLHHVVNPHGFRFAVGCFADAAGVYSRGEPEDAYSWFPGCFWQISYCAGCHVHLGWLFSGAERFFGLVVDRLEQRGGH